MVNGLRGEPHGLLLYVRLHLLRSWNFLLHPGVSHDLVDRESAVLVEGEHASHEGLEVVGEFFHSFWPFLAMSNPERDLVLH